MNFFICMSPNLIWIPIFWGISLHEKHREKVHLRDREILFIKSHTIEELARLYAEGRIPNVV